ncbi:helix-turn-helix transcriptional regulator [Streptosporangium sp. NBC_01755]|uniref:helix-turn-helix domain-containing protein n=1 Tax=unclassified Streptosporangium TaxID=2632669 RepID=UPI002DDA3E99|nr:MULTISPECIES: helix-turn-helix transcriptional regulator [unclassified Streptosporangium]WSA24124.1 helix-turn-helix transcriptional regulator [Streptosporangium sp. NBC_01810]WSC97802.1 helix-turn-helix transcriptional regulator [Streptosporangium sp. NBC_01755]
MPAPRELDPKAGRNAAFGVELRRLRLGAGLTQEELGNRIGYSTSQVGSVEVGKRAPTEPFIAGCEVGFGPGLREVWADLSKHRDEAPKWFRPWLEEEAEALSITTCQPLVVPGLLQTAAYAHALLKCECRYSDDQIEALVAARLARQKIFTRTNPPRYLVLLDEGVLSRPIGGPKVMCEQLKRLLEVVDLPHITIQITPLGANPGLSGGIVIAQAPKGHRHTVYLETAAEPVVTSNPEVVNAVTIKMDIIRAESLPHSASVEFIGKMVEKWTSRLN